MALCRTSGQHPQPNLKPSIFRRSAEGKTTTKKTNKQTANKRTVAGPAYSGDLVVWLKLGGWKKPSERQLETPKLKPDPPAPHSTCAVRNNEVTGPCCDVGWFLALDGGRSSGFSCVFLHYPSVSTCTSWDRLFRNITQQCNLGAWRTPRF